jgi:hypothetical protein
MQLHDIVGDHVDTIPIGATPAANTATAAIAVWNAPFRCKIQSIEFVPTVAVVGANANTRTLQATEEDGATEIGALAFTLGVNTAVGVPSAFTLSATAARTELGNNDPILIRSVLVGTGLALPAGSIRIKYRGM